MTQSTPLASAQKLLDVLAVTQALTAEVDLNALLVKIMDAATRLLHAERSTLYLIDGERGELVSKIAQHTGLLEIRLPLGTGIAGQVAVTGDVAVIPDVHLDARFNSAFDTKTGFQTRDMLVVPVVNSRQQRIGVIQVMNSMEQGLVDHADLTLLQALASSAAVAIENARLYERIETMLQSFVLTLSASIDARDPQTAGHSLRVGGYASTLARELGVSADQRRLIYLSGLLHDYGKIGVPESILTKPGRLSDDEMSLMRGHATLSREILQNVKFTEDLSRIPDIVYQHHERIDGGGYPQGLSGDQISFEGRLLAICDVFDALTQRRYYREPITHAEAFEYIADNRGTHFDAELADLFGSVLLRQGSMTELHPDGHVDRAAAVSEAMPQVRVEPAPS